MPPTSYNQQPLHASEESQGRHHCSPYAGSLKTIICDQRYHQAEPFAAATSFYSIVLLGAGQLAQL